jgi:hypothetical protein
MKASGQLHVPAVLPLEEESLYLLDGRLGGPHNRSGRCGEENILDPTGILTPAVQPVAHRYTD